ncbi:MAG: hypothetical protein Q8922_05300 [Bacteroidota bacterium]|nr:hypothetical protein [Bacteroidota bacterium]MDP4231884.1 hypothetical protein [Bacteroidota bacterium]MDP4241409.1 hypothetical protein [Bacteroidota bacterium]MDP4287332.1 hypothetical protein [Bacteroidota bacterium]
MKSMLYFAAGLLLFGALSARAQESAIALAQRAEASVLRSPGVSMTVRVPQQGSISVKIDFHAKRIRIESPSNLIISDGSTLWNLSKSTNRLTIDNVAKTGSPFADPAMVFQFAEHYAAQVSHRAGQTYTLDLTPDGHLSALLNAASGSAPGGAQKLQLTLRTNGKSIKIVKAQVMSSRGVQQTSSLTIKPINKIRSDDFLFKQNASMKVIDLRE